MARTITTLSVCPKRAATSVIWRFKGRGRRNHFSPEPRMISIQAFYLTPSLWPWTQGMLPSNVTVRRSRLDASYDCTGRPRSGSGAPAAADHGSRSGPPVHHLCPRRHPSAVRQSSNALGGQINQPLVAVPGYIRKFRVRVNSTGGSATANVTQYADSPYNVFSNVQLYDSFGTPLIIAPGYEAMKLIPKYGGQHFQWVASDPGNLPSWTAMTTAAGNTSGMRLSRVRYPWSLPRASVPCLEPMLRCCLACSSR